MTFETEHTDDFLAHFEKIKHKISDMPGCENLRLHQDLASPNVFFTYSTWRSDADLQYYRQSELFIETWKIVKAWFAARAEAWSVDTIFDSAC